MTKLSKRHAHLSAGEFAVLRAKKAAASLRVTNIKRKCLAEADQKASEVRRGFFN